MSTDMPGQGKPEKHPVSKFFTNGFVQGVVVFIALAVAFSGKLDSKGTLVAVLVAGAIGAIGIYTHWSNTVRQRIVSIFSILVYECALWAFYSYLTSKPTVSAGNTTVQQQDAKPSETKPEEKKSQQKEDSAKKAKPQPRVEQQSQGDNSPNINQQSSGPNSPNIVGNNNTFNIGDPKTNARLDEIKELLLAQQGNRIAPDKLLAKYPLGYVIFDVDYMNSVFPYRTQAVDKWDFEWNVVKFTQNTQKEAYIYLPDIRPKGDSRPIMKNVAIGGPKKVGSFPDGGGPIFSDGIIAMKAEILAISEKGIVFLIGFDKAPKSPKN